MPYFDDLTYSITHWIRRNEIDSLVECANDFIAEMEDDPEYYPAEFVAAAKAAVKNKNLNEIIILADANTAFFTHAGAAFRAELDAANTPEDMLRLLLIIHAAESTFRFRGAHIPYMLMKEAFHKYSETVGYEDYKRMLSEVLNPFLSKIKKRNRILRAEAQRELDEELIRWDAEERQEKARKERQKAERQKRIQEMNERQHQKQLEASAKRLEELAEFNKLPLEKKLEIMLGDGKRLPEYYGIDYEAISDDELNAVSANILQQVVVSFPKVKDAKWKEFKKRVKGILSTEAPINA